MGPLHDVRALLLDVDGTLYHAGPLRRRIVASLLASAALRPISTRRALRHIRGYRRALEEIRHSEPSTDPIGDLHVQRAAELAGDTTVAVRATVREWMLTRPLRHLERCRRAGIRELLVAARERGLQVGFFSDYPVTEKLEALGLADLASLTLCGADPEINAYKPWPHGFRHACDVWGLSPEQVVYIGDRMEIDAAGAAAAGMRCILVGERGGRSASASACIVASTFGDVRRLILDE